ncbi:MAG TPA: Chromate resistance protein ChrB [Syntrophobacteraceae bacterium]|nr:Chromate resistance protein ChrB [Syntrophobacteraceae bacterium]
MKWIMLIYKMPRSKTTAIKVATWRKLKKLGVYQVQDSVCILPYSEKTLENLEWLAAELRELGGEASVWETQALTPGMEKELKEYFLEQVNTQYKEIMREASLAKSGRQLSKIWMRYNSVKTQDYLKSPLATEARGACENRAQVLRQEEDKS